MIKTLLAIEGNKILLRPFTIENRAAKKMIDKVKDIRKHLGCQSNLEIGIKEFQQHGYGLLAIVDRVTDDWRIRQAHNVSEKYNGDE